ncbi:MAG: hypothetical protein V4629_01935 [Pseudomonadota bacterium]
MNLKALLKKTFILCSIVFLIIVVSETVFKKLGYPVSYSALFEYDKEIGFITPKSKTVTFLTGKNIYEVNFDSNGIIDNFEGKVENIILGDGLVAGMELPKKSRLAYKVGEQIQQGTINLSVTGHGVYQQALLLERYIKLKGITPKNVIIIFNYESDLFDHISELNSPLKPGFSYLSDSNKFIKPKIPNFLYANLSSVWRSSSLIQWVVQNFFKSKKIKKILPDATVYILKNPDSEIGKIAILSVNESFKKIKKLGENYGFNILVIEWVPPNFEKLVTSKEMEKIRSKMKETFHAYFLVNPCRYCLGIDSANKVFIKDSHHLNSHATEILAHEISKELKSK